jgi:hypothetical protein
MKQWAMIAGCSHTAGTAIESTHCYVHVLQQHLQLPITNCGVPGGNSSTTLASIVSAVQADSKPKFIVAQWPNPVRKSIWINGKHCLQNINACEESFRLLLKHDINNFYEPWTQSVIVANLLCNLANVTIINILLENINAPVMAKLTKQNIILHVDEKLPGQTWLFDSAASDKLHHSAACHKQWAERLTKLLNEYTTP